MNAANGLSIGQVAKAAGVHVESIRFYERRQLVAQPEKPYRGMRRYPAGVVARIQFIKHAQELGFTLTEIQELLGLQVDRKNTCGEVKQRAERKRAAVRAKLEALAALEHTLTRMINACAKGAALDHSCPILLALEDAAPSTAKAVVTRRSRTRK